MIPVAKPKLPSFSELSPYLKRIDDARVYSNFGALELELRERLAERFGDGYLAVTGSSATSLLTAALLVISRQSSDRRHVAIPAWSFSATAHSVVSAGLIPTFIDIDERNWGITPSQLSREARQDLAAVIPVLPFGDASLQEQWVSFYAETGIPVILDAAAAFDSLKGSIVPAIVSLHATKVLGCGEGGFMITKDDEFAKEVQATTSFGFSGSPYASFPGLNSKMSEYHAAVALAALDKWVLDREAWVRVSRTYEAQLKQCSILAPIFSAERASSTVNIIGDKFNSENIEVDLARLGIMVKRWWGCPLPEQNAFRHFAQGQTFPRASSIASKAIGLPCFTDLEDEEILRVTETLEKFLSF